MFKEVLACTFEVFKNYLQKKVKKIWLSVKNTLHLWYHNLGL